MGVFVPDSDRAWDPDADWKLILQDSIMDAHEVDLLDEAAAFKAFYGYSPLNVEKVVAYGQLGRALFELFSPLHGEKLDAD